MTAHFLLLFANYILVAFLAIPGYAAQQEGLPDPTRSKTDLPSESSLPGQAVTSLPDESSLPDQLPLVSSTPEANDSGSHTVTDYPAEYDLPPTWGGNDVKTDSPLTEVSPNDPLLQPNGGEIAEQLKLDQNHPWLRLNVGGPTAPLKALKFTGDSKHLLVGGDDKALHVWSLVDDASGVKVWTYANPVLWQVQRGTRGAIRAIDVNANRIAFAGVGGSSSMGELILVNPDDLRFQGSLFDKELGPRNYINSLAVDESGRVSSIDVEGRVVTWNRDTNTGQWRLSTLRQSDRELFDGPIARELHRFRLVGSAIATSKHGDLIYQELATPFKIGDDFPKWNLVRRSGESNQTTTLKTAEPHSGTVTAIGISADGNRIVSADQTQRGRAFVWNLSKSPIAATFDMDAPIRTISVSPSGHLLLIGTEKSRTDIGGLAKGTLWQWNDDGQFKLLASWKHDDHVLAGNISPDEKWIAYTLRNSVQVRAIDRLEGNATVLQGKLHFPINAQFSANANEDYRILISSKVATEPSHQLIFETARPRLADVDVSRADKWVASNPFPQRWRLEKTEDKFGNLNWFVSIDSIRKGQIPLDLQLDGSVTCASWIFDPRNVDRPVAIIVGTSLRNHIYIFGIADSGECSLIRQYRGHSAPVNSTGISQDRRYLLSSSQDGTVCIWKLEDALSGRPSMESTNRWGAEFQIENDKLVVKSLVPDGPLYFRGLRADDIIDKLTVPNSRGTIETKQTPQEMLSTLNNSDWRQMLGFYFSRRGEVQPYFYLFPAWQPIASLVVAEDREWAYWTPYGYYDASFNGHKMFGWQVNRGIDSPPEFFRASEMKNELEKPQLMEKLLVAGNIEDAFQAFNHHVPADIQNRVASENRLRPRVEIQAPAAGSLLTGAEARIEAVIESPSGIDLARPKAFANGVPAIELKLEGSTDDGSKQRQVYSWKAQLPNEKNIRVQVFASTQYGSADVAHIDVTRGVAESSATRRLFLIAAGINQYDDGQIPQLEFAVNNVTAIKDVIASPDNRLYETEAALLANKSVSRSLWSAATDSFLDRLKKEARPDDLLVVFLSGHGFRDPASEQYFYLTAATRHADLLGRRYADCISLEDFGKFSEIPCRKIVILDTCHSGAVQALSQSNLKTIVRALENDLIFTLTASEGNEEAFESTEQQMSYFSAALLQALRGDADKQAHGGDENGSVDFSEVVRYVKESVPRQINRLGQRQYPTATPAELFGFAEIPMTSIGNLQK